MKIIEKESIIIDRKNQKIKVLPLSLRDKVEVFDLQTLIEMEKTPKKIYLLFDNGLESILLVAQSISEEDYVFLKIIIDKNLKYEKNINKPIFIKRNLIKEEKEEIKKEVEDDLQSLIIAICSIIYLIYLYILAGYANKDSTQLPLYAGLILVLSVIFAIFYPVFNFLFSQINFFLKKN